MARTSNKDKAIAYAADKGITLMYAAIRQTN